MSRHPLENMLRGLRTLITKQELGHLSDGQLLERFVSQREEAAFAVLMQRHGAMVLGVCRRVLGRAQDAEDACQATFLTLVRRAAAIRRGDSLASWLYGVAYRIARQLQARTRRERTAADINPPAPDADPEADLSWREVWSLLDAELQRLPEHYRQPLILCYLEGKTRDEAARELQWTLGTFKRRLEQGRNLLRSRLTRRGVTLPAALCGAALAPGMTSAAPPPLLMVQTSKAALALAAGQAPAAILASPVAALLEGGVPVAGAVKVKAAVALLLVVALLGGGAVVWRHPKAGKQESPQPPPLLVQQMPRRERPAIPKEDALPDGALARLGTQRLRHGGQVRSVAVSPDGKVLASAGWDWAVRLWDMRTGQELRSIAGPDGWFWCVAFSPDGTKLAAGGDKRDQKIHLYDAAAGEELHCLKGHTEEVYTVAFSPDGRTLASGGSDAVIRLWDLASGAERVRLAGHQGAVRTLAFAADGRTLASGGEDATIRLWDLDSGQERAVLRGHRRRVTSVAFSPDGWTLISASEDETLRLWDVAAGMERQRLTEQAGVIQTVAFAPDGRHMASGDAEGVVYLWQTTTGEVRHRCQGHHGAITSLAFTPDSRVLISGSEDHRVRLWSTAGGTEVCPQPGHQSWVACVAYSPDGRLLATAGEDHTLRLWDAATRRPVCPPIVHEQAVTALAFAPDGRLLVSADAAGMIYFWHPSTGAARSRLQGHTDRIGALAFSPDGATLASGGNDGTIRLWESVTGRMLRSWRGHEMLRSWRGSEGLVRCLGFSPDGKTLASGASDARLCLWDVTTEGKEAPRRTRVLSHQRAVTSLAFAADGRMLASGCGEGKVHFWEVATGAERAAFGPFQRGDWGQTTVVFAPASRLLASGTANQVRLWDRLTGQELHCFQGHRGWIWSFAFSPDGRTLLSGSDDTTVICWDVTPFLPATEERAAELSAGELMDLWPQLGDADAAAAYHVMGRLGRVPKQAVPFLQERLLTLASSGVQSGDLRALRAMEVLELLARVEARHALKTLAEKARGNWLGEEATAALKRRATR